MSEKAIHARLGRIGMADFESMREKHRKDSMIALSFFIFILLLFLFDNYFASVLNQAVRGPKDLFSIVGQSWVKFLGTMVSPFVSYFLGILTIAKRDFYYDIDNLFFKRRKRVDRFICMEMLNFTKRLSIDETKKIEKLKGLVTKEGRSDLLMELFYKYIEKPEIVNPELKNQAFIYWGDYFSKITFLSLGVCIFIIAVLIVVISGSVTCFRLGLFFIMGFFMALNLISIFRGKIAKKLLGIPKTQISQIHRSAEKALLKELKSASFGINHETPS